jgi:hypothetical protein
MKKELAVAQTFHVSKTGEDSEDTVLFENSGYGARAFLFALANKHMQVITVEDNEDKVAVAKACAGIPKNLKIYSKSEWKNT